MKLIIRMLVRSSPSLSLSLSLTLQLCLLVISNLSCFSGEEPKCSGSVNNYTFFASNMCSMVDTLYTSLSVNSQHPLMIEVLLKNTALFLDLGLLAVNSL
ncbi:hypothetical protein PPACK8108_LOCUS898 [Phakopsora pachyrhizi]|uniref:Secreted protein n=1 Tax=Phakopsora pachyrhizi TaxID=170000 RepID=A0AAV0AFW8_PHAPC|nr:hypothetical protein PPACK8108_LOCUS898 [Phakopsora pachyrhizi]